MLDECKVALEAAGFQEEPADELLGHVRRSFFRNTDSPPWLISAKWDNSEREHLEVALCRDKQTDNIGTIYMFWSVAAIAASLSNVLAELERLAREPELLKCPECGTRWVRVNQSPT